MQGENTKYLRDENEKAQSSRLISDNAILALK
jgi:hypothetical protein